VNSRVKKGGKVEKYLIDEDDYVTHCDKLRGFERYLLIAVRKLVFKRAELRSLRCLLLWRLGEGKY